MPIAIESNSLGQYLDFMESQLVMLGSVIFQPNNEQKTRLLTEWIHALIGSTDQRRERR